MKLKSIDKNLTVTFVSGVITATLLACSFGLLSNLSLKSKNETNTISVELDQNLYSNLSSLLTPANVLAAESDTPFVPVDDELYVLIDGEQYPVVETEDGLMVIQNENIEDSSVPLAEAIGCEDPNIIVDEYGNRYYHIVWGDTLCEISSLLNYSVNELAEYNHIENINWIYAESDLRIPD